MGPGVGLQPRQHPNRSTSAYQPNRKYATEEWMSPKKKVAALISEYRPRSHADVIVGRLLQGYYLDGQHHEPGVEIVSMYTDQVADMDMSRQLAAQHGFALCASIRQALTLKADQSRGPRNLAVDGVLLICEHGAYPYNSLGQKLYPRHRFFKEMVDVFRDTGKHIPVFFDKHYSCDWHQAKWMYDQARQLGFPLMAGSVIPLGRHPDLRWPKDRPIDKAIGIWEADFAGNKDSYGFHAIELLQSIVEQRPGAETGIAAVQCLEGEAVWAWTDARDWARQLLAAAGLGEARGQIKNPMVFSLIYNDGLETAVYRLNGLGRDGYIAALVPNQKEPVVLGNRADTPSHVYLPQELADRYPIANHFSATAGLFEEMLDSGQEPHPAERTLLTSGALAALFESSYEADPMYGETYEHGRFLEEGKYLTTPYLAIHYDAPSN